jgi:multiple sugar transport system permease protein
VKKRRYLPYVLAFPSLAYILGLAVFPLAFSLWMTFHKWVQKRGLSPFKMPFSGVQNFIKLFQDDRFSNALLVTFKTLIVAVPIEFFMGLGVALLLNRKKLRGGSFYLTLMLVPLMLPMVTGGLVWKMMLHLDYGIINGLIMRLGLNPVDWLLSSTWALGAVIVVDIWQWTPFVVLILLAGLRSIPNEPLEAARIDGASHVQVFRFIIWPLISWPVLVVLLMRSIDIFKIFDSVYALTRGGPGEATTTLAYYLYIRGFQRFELGYASAMSWVIFFIVYFLVFLILKFRGTKEVEA